MSATYGPIIFPATGQIVQINISQQTIAMIVENQSLNDLLFSVSPSQPQVVTQANAAALIAAGQAITSGGWDLHVGPRQAGVLQIPTSALTQTPAGGYWTGILWAQQVTITNALVTAGSFVSNPGENVWVTAYGPGEKIPDAGLTSIGYFLASQERNVGVPVSPGIQFIGNKLNTSAGIFQSFSTISIGNFPFSNNALAAGLVASGVIVVFVYGARLTMWPLSAVAGTAEWQHVSLAFNLLDSSSALVSATPTFYDDFFEHLALQSSSRSNFGFVNPIPIVLTCAAGAGPPYSLNLLMNVDNNGGGGGTNIKRMSINLPCDVGGAIPFGAGGGLFGLSTGSTYNGFVY